MTLERFLEKTVKIVFKARSPKFDQYLTREGKVVSVDAHHICLVSSRFGNEYCIKIEDVAEIEEVITVTAGGKR